MTLQEASDALEACSTSQIIQVNSGTDAICIAEVNATTTAYTGNMTTLINFVSDLSGQDITDLEALADSEWTKKTLGGNPHGGAR